MLFTFFEVVTFCNFWSKGHSRIFNYYSVFASLAIQFCDFL